MNDPQAIRRLQAVVGNVPEGDDAAAATAFPTLRDAVGKLVGSPAGKRTQATQLLELAAGAELWTAPDGTPYATLDVGAHREHWAIRSRAVRRWLVRRFYDETEKPPGAQALADALGVLEARAQFDGERHEVFVRVGGNGRDVYIDLADAEWRAVRVGPDGWTVVSGPPIRFRRAPGMAELPEPFRGGTVDLLRPFLNLPADADFRLFVAVLLAYLRPQGPYPVAAITGEHDSAKSTTSRRLRELVDPNEVPLRAPPRDERDLFIAASNGWLIGFDNLSTMRPWLSDALARLATGGGFATRELYSDADEKLFSATRPVLLNGIGDIAEREDLRDRAVFFDLPPLRDEMRRPEAELNAEFERVRPLVLGALLDGVAAGLRNYEAVRCDGLPRMADFARWATACEVGMGWEPGTFLREYNENRQDAVMVSVEHNIVARYVMALVESTPEWTGTATELLDALAVRATEAELRRKDWPGAPKVLSERLNRAAPALRRLGFEVKRGKRGGRWIRIRKVPPACVPSVPCVRREPQGVSGEEVTDATAPDAPAPRDAPCVQTAAVRTHANVPNGNELDAPDAPDAPARPFSNRREVEL